MFKKIRLELVGSVKPLRGGEWRCPKRWAPAPTPRAKQFARRRISAAQWPELYHMASNLTSLISLTLPQHRITNAFLFTLLFIKRILSVWFLVRNMEDSIGERGASIRLIRLPVRKRKEKTPDSHVIIHSFVKYSGQFVVKVLFPKSKTLVSRMLKCVFGLIQWFEIYCSTVAGDVCG